MAGKRDSSSENLSCCGTATLVADTWGRGALWITLPLGNLKQLPFTSIKIENFLKKSAPKIGCATLATRKECFVVIPGNFSESVLVPKVSIKEPLAARRRWPGRDTKGTDLKEVGSTEMSAPLSTRKRCPDSSS